MTDLDWQQFVTEPEPGIIEFELKPEHVKILRSVKFSWNPDGHGGPTFNVHRPFGSLHFFRDLSEVIEQPEPVSTADQLKMYQLYNQACFAIQIVLKTGKFKATTYRADKFDQNWSEYNPNARKPRVPKQPALDLD